MPSPTEQYRYWAFISYSSKDAATAKKLHKRLETYSIPKDLRGRPGRDEPVPKKLFPIFRDREELPLSADLGGSIEDALRASRYLIVLCSPNSAQSRWVNEEIRYFKSLGREDRILAIILGGEPNASDDPDAAEEECFPPALRYAVDENGELTDERTEPIGGDLRPGGDGWTSIFLKAVAGVTGLGYDAFARREQKRRRRRQMVAAALAFLALIGGLWTWDHYRVKTDYYANVATVWGLPTGVGELSAEMRRGRQYHYRFYSSQRKLRRVERVNSAGTLRNDEDSHGASVREVEYSEDGILKQIDLRDHNGKLTLRKVFGDTTETADGTVQYIDFQQEHESAPMMIAAGVVDDGINVDNSQKSDITAHRVRFDERGRVREITYFNAYRQNRANADGVYGKRFTYGGALLPTRIENLGYEVDIETAMAIADRTGVVAVEYKRNAFGDETFRQYRGKDGRPTLNWNGIHYITQTRDERGNTAEISFFSLNGEAVAPQVVGVHRLRRAHDEWGNLIEEAYFGPDGGATLHVNGYHCLTRAHDERGNLVEEAYFGTGGEPTLRLDGDYHRITQAYDERGNAVELAYFGTRGERVELAGAGVHRIMLAYDERGNEVEQTYFGTDGEPTLYTEIAHRMTQNYDKRDNLVGWAYFGTRGEPVVRPGTGVHRVTQAYDKRGNLAEQAGFGTRGERVERSDTGIHRIMLTYDEWGNLVEEAYFSTDGETVLDDKGGYHHRTLLYDERGNRVGWAFFGTDGKPTLYENSYHRLTQTFDERGNAVEQALFGTEGEPTLHENGYHRITQAYDKWGNVVEMAYFGTDGEPTLHKDGNHHLTRVYDERGNKVEEAYFGTNGEPVLDSDGVHLLRQAYDERGNLVEEAYFGTDGEPVLIAGRYHRTTSVYDAKGNEVGWSLYGVDGELLRSSE